MPFTTNPAPPRNCGRVLILTGLLIMLGSWTLAALL
jgi:hypothetical protein